MSKTQIYENKNNSYIYTNPKMSAINTTHLTVLLNVIPSDLINDVMSYDAHTCCMKEIKKGVQLSDVNLRIFKWNYYNYTVTTLQVLHRHIKSHQRDYLTTLEFLNENLEFLNKNDNKLILQRIRTDIKENETAIRNYEDEMNLLLDR